MKKILLFLLVFAALPLFAQKNLEFAYETSDYSYREPSGYAIGLKGKKHGASLRYETRMRDTPMFAAFEGRYMKGTTDYDGWLQSLDPSDPPVKHEADGIKDYYYEARFNIGQIYEFSQEMQLWLGSGLGDRYLKDHMEKDPSGYLRESTYIYMPFTANLRYDTDRWGLALNAEFDWLIYGKQISHLSKFGWPYDDVRNDQHKGFGLRFGLKANVNLSEKTSLFIEPFYRYWQIANSKITDGFVEPYNTTEEFGLRIGMTFCIGSNSEVYSL